jgi:hypothetical protein
MTMAGLWPNWPPIKTRPWAETLANCRSETTYPPAIHIFNWEKMRKSSNSTDDCPLARFDCFPKHRWPLCCLRQAYSDWLRIHQTSTWSKVEWNHLKLSQLAFVSFFTWFFD